MTLPSTLINKTEWTFVGPMGPQLPDFLKTHPIIAVDGGAHHSAHTDVWVGDADSYTKEIKQGLIFRHPAQKDQSDLALALSLFQEPAHYKFHFWGFLGGRKDHELFNLGEALSFLEHHQECQILFYDGEGKIHFHLVGNGHWKFTHMGLFSLGTLKKTSIKLKGECHYPILHSTVLNPLSSLGLSNVGKGEMTLENEGPVFIYYPEGK
jgi:thiamine pyrophosphokinase